MNTDTNQSNLYKHVLSYPKDYGSEFVRTVSLYILQNPNYYPHLQERATILLYYGLQRGEKPRFRVKCKSVKRD
jgi:beta-xylosidase